MKCSRKGGGGSCKRNAARGSRWCSRHRAAWANRDRAAWFHTQAGIAAGLRRNRSYPRADADALAARLFDVFEACELCGVPNWALRALFIRGGPFKRGPADSNRRLQVDRVDTYGAHVLENTRLACWPCNARRGAGVVSDETAASETRRWWLENAPADLIEWLDTPAPCGPAPAADLSTAF